MSKNIFISHSWKHSDDYDRLINLLENCSYFNFSDYSVSIHNPLEASVWGGLENRIKYSSIVILPVGQYATHSDSINKEISIAQKHNKPILAIKPYGNINTSKLTDYCDKTVNWNTESIVSAIRELW